ncbi:hypothetical protein SAMN05216227_100233 [Pseudorhodobacter antarcticus]|uniref:Uncharacterized protein n=1 Tax=Pseudorhodobacter antarcticus TaxID=1077947 RepID=A0A1H8AXA4_9RHOB|nr:hypothetical protein [Pseudorhodobacter antarcticus]SEM75116.1 hypothetical protein SAMN05216227_100233 [Pseudorhodobacter antarcticus]
MDGRIWISLRIFAALFEKIPMIEARVMLPSAVLLIAFPVCRTLWPDQPDIAFVVAFVLCQTARFSLRWRAQFAREARREGTGRKRMVGAFLIPGAVIFAAQSPELCQHVPSMISAGFVILFAIDAMDSSYSTARAYWPGAVYAPYARELTQAMLVLHLIYILLNETMIAAVSLEGWVVFYAFLPVVHHVLLTAFFRTVFWVTPDPERRS